MIFKAIGIIILILIIVFFLLWLYIRYYQTHGIYFPTSTISYTPDEFGLEYKEISFTATDGVKLNGWYITAENPIGTLLFLHGNAGNIGHRIPIIQLFHDLDLNVFIFDYHGYGKSEGKPSEEGLYQDALGAFRYLTNELNCNPDKLIIYGKSIGGNVAINLASRVEAKVLISDSAFSSAIDMGTEIFPFLPSFLMKKFISVKYNALSKIKNIKIPKLIIHSVDDEMIPFKQGLKLFKAAPEPKEFYKIHGSHNESIFIYKDEYSLKIRWFIKKYL